MTRKLPIPDETVSPVVRNLADLGRLVRNQRAHARLRIDDAASLSLVSPDMLSRLENGKPVTVDKLMLVLEGLGLRILVVPARALPHVESALRSSSHTTERSHG
ncbi:helix-turn-helix domain-containing protein [Variovorax sp. LjRoot175]|uniref:helix-turn-helix domain-containing protein n=1 Tax=Variovorax sp. LjRoot175 TaxID=3342276 RepID=UPI003ECDDB18